MKIRIANRGEHPYTLVDNAILNNQNLSFQAKGLLCWLLSRPDDWTVIIVDIVNRFGAHHGVKSIRSILKELKGAKYVVVNPIRDARGLILTYEYTIHEKPQESEADYGELIDKIENLENLQDYPEGSKGIVENLQDYPEGPKRHAAKRHAAEGPLLSIECEKEKSVLINEDSEEKKQTNAIEIKKSFSVLVKIPEPKLIKTGDELANELAELDSNSTLSDLVVGYMDEYYKMIATLESSIKKADSLFKVKNVNRWLNDFKLMHLKDKRDIGEIYDVMSFARKDSFWSANILSPGKLREKFTTLKIQMENQLRKSTNERSSNIGRFISKPKYSEFDTVENR